VKTLLDKTYISCINEVIEFAYKPVTVVITFTRSVEAGDQIGWELNTIVRETDE
jgi:hypothetical protein